jgi:CHAT domain-containing protein
VLQSARAEAQEVAGLFVPPAAEVDPDIMLVTDLLRGSPPCDVLHVALHGKFDDQLGAQGIVLLEKSPAGGAVGRYLTPEMMETGELDRGPFVFLNACQVGSDQQVLGDYAGFATTLLRIGAAAVVAPLWNVDDVVAHTVAKTFYAAAWTGPDRVPAAEAIRALRATYTEAAVTAGDASMDPTLIAYQVYGHPRLLLAPPADPQP